MGISLYQNVELCVQASQEVYRIMPKKSNFTTVKVIYVVLEAQLRLSLAAVVQSLNKSNKYTSFEVMGYLVEELRDENNYNSVC